MKRTVIHLASRTEKHLQSGSVYRIDRRLERRGSSICLDRTYSHHGSIAGMRSILIPTHNLWVIFFEGRQTPCPVRCYMHMARILDEGASLIIEDLYLDVVVKQDGTWQVLDVGEFREAVSAGELSPDQVEAALAGLEHACRLVDICGGEIEAYLHRMLAAKV